MMLSKIVIIFVLMSIGHAWDSEDLELFDLVEEVNQNFYEVMGLEQSASSSDIRRAYRKMSLQYHPDKNKEENAEEKFRQIVAIAEVLKDEEKRKKYHDVLEHGLPDWRQPVYYYRRVRKMGLIELVLFLFVLITIGQYLFYWSAYWEKKFELEEIFTSKLKKIERKNKKIKSSDQAVSELMAEELDQLQKPRYQDLLPFQFIYLIIFLIKNIHTVPMLVQNIKNSIKGSQNSQYDDEEDEYSDSDEPGERIRKPRKRHVAEMPDYSDMPDCYEPAPMFDTAVDSQELVGASIEKEATEWVEKDFIGLMKAMKKFPGGSTNRWEKISEMMNKPLNEVTKMAKKVKSSSYSASVPVAVQGLTGRKEDNASDIALIDTSLENSTDDSVKKRKATKVVKSDERTKMISQCVPKANASANDSSEAPLSSDDSGWSQHQQKALELALQQFPKGHEERWDRIAGCVPNKSKEECMLRFKMLAEIVKKRKGLKVS